MASGTNDQASIPYTIRYSTRARRLGATVYPGGHVVVTMPRRADTSMVTRFLVRHSRWLRRAMSRLKRQAPRTKLPGGARDYAAHKSEALAYVRERIQELNKHYGFAFDRVSVKDIRSRWGSCSRKGNLNFSYKIMYLPPEIADYVIVHELCHLAHFDHSRDFWNRVAEVVPDHRALRARLRTFAL